MSENYIEFIDNVINKMSHLHTLWKEDEASKTDPYPFDYQGLNTKNQALVSSFEAFDNKNVLDIGCNSGLYSYLMGYVANSVLGCDIDNRLLNRADIVRTFFDDFYETKHIDFFCGNFVEKLNYNVDAILACCVLYHIGDENLKLLSKFLSKSNCTIIIQARPQRGEAFRKNPEWGKVSNTKLYGGIYTLESNLEFLRDCGYDKVEILGLSTSKFYSETFPVIVARK